MNNELLQTALNLVPVQRGGYELRWSSRKGMWVWGYRHHPRWARRRYDLAAHGMMLSGWFARLRMCGYQVIITPYMDEWNGKNILGIALIRRAYMPKRTKAVVCIDAAPSLVEAVANAIVAVFGDSPTEKEK